MGATAAGESGGYVNGPEAPHGVDDGRTHAAPERCDASRQAGAGGDERQRRSLAAAAAAGGGRAAGAWRKAAAKARLLRKLKVSAAK